MKRNPAIKGALFGLVAGIVLAPLLAYWYVQSNPGSTVGDNGIAIPILGCFVLGGSILIGAAINIALATLKD